MVLTKLDRHLKISVKKTLEEVKIFSIVIMSIEKAIFIIAKNHSFLFLMEDQSTIFGIEGVLNDVLIRIDGGVIGVG